MKFLFNFYLIFYVIYQVFAENENKTNIIEEILNNVTDDNDIIYIENSTFNILKEKYEKVKENLTNLEIKTVLLNLDELPENSTLEKFSNDLLNELKNKKNWFNENDSLIYSLFLSNNSGIIIVNYPNITNDTLEELLNETKNDKPEDRISKVMNNLLDKIVTNPELDDSSESKDNSTSQIKDDSSESKDNSTSQIKDDSTSESNDNSTSQIKDDSTSESQDNSTSQIKDDSTSESKDNSTSQSKDDSTSESKDNSTSQIKDSSTSESQDNSTSQIKDSSTSESKDNSTSQSKDDSESQSKVESKSQSKDESESQSKEESKSQSKDDSESQSKDDSDDDDGLSAGKIVLIVLSCVAGLIIIVIVVACLCKRNKQDAYNAVNQTSFKDNKLLDED